MARFMRGRTFSVLAVICATAVVGLCSLAGTLQLSRRLVEREELQWQQRADAEAAHIAEQLRSGIAERLGPLRRVGVWWELQGRPLDSADWQTDMRLFFESGSGLRRLTWVDISGKKSWSAVPDSAPEDQSRDAVPAQLQELVSAMRRRTHLALSRTFDEPDGRRALYACVPVLRRGVVAGYLSGLYDATELLQSALQHQAPRDYSVSVLADGRELALFNRNNKQRGRIEQTARVPVANVTWLARVRVGPDDLLSLRNLVLSFGLAVSLLLSISTLLGGIAYRRSIALKQEIRERRAAEQKVAVLNRDLQRRLTDFQTLLEVTPIGIAVSDDAECRRIWINPALAAMMGVREGQNISKSGPEADRLGFQVLREGQPLAPQDLPMQVAGRTGQEAAAEELDIVRADGRLVHTLAYTAPLFDEERRVRGVLHVSVDITPRKRGEQERKLLEEKLLRAEKFKSLALMAGGLAHDLNNLLASVIGNDSLALQEISHHSHARDLLLHSLEASHKAAGLMQQLVRYTGNTFYTAKPLDISRVIQELREALRDRVPQNISLDFELCDHLPLAGAGLVEVQQVLINLVTNAVDAIGERPGRISVTTRTFEVPDGASCAPWDEQEISSGQYVEVVVADSGCGMSPDIAAKAFDPFFTTKFLGRGLGLAEVQGVLRAHRGAVRVESSPAGGSRFLLLFPALPAGSAAAAQAGR